MRKRIISIILSVMIVFTLTACGDSSTDNNTEGSADTETAGDGNTIKDTADMKLGIVVKSPDEFMNQEIAGAKDAALKAGIKEENITVVTPSSESDAMQQVTAIEDMISKKIDILLCDCMEENALKGVLQRASDAGIKVVMIGTDCPPFEDKVTCVGTNNYDAAYNGALEFAKRLEKGDNVVLLRGKLGDVNHEARTEGMTKALEESGMNLLEVQDANCETDKAASAMEDFMTKYPGEIDAVMVTTDSMAIGAYQAIDGASVSGIKICGFDGFQAAIELLAEGKLEMIIAQNPYKIGGDAVTYALGSMEGETYDSFIDMGIEIIDSENYTEFMK